MGNGRSDIRATVLVHLVECSSHTNVWLCSGRANISPNAEGAALQGITIWRRMVARSSKFRGFEKQTIVLHTSRTTQKFRRPAFGGTVASFEVSQSSGVLRDKHVVDLFRPPVAFCRHGNLPCNWLVSVPRAVCFQTSNMFMHSCRNAPSRIQPSPKFLLADLVKSVLLCRGR
jgi:hypothetical protein